MSRCRPDGTGCRRCGRGSRRPRSLVELVNVRVSQMNGCARCLSVHVPAAREASVDEAKLHLASVWREAGVFSDVERAGLEIAELTTELPAEAARAA
ncbi:carboxymuconolactone decarboxylase family protein [Gulosibacter sediminis]